MGGRHRHVTDEEDEQNLDDDHHHDGDDVDVYMYSTDMHLDKWHAYKATIRASKATKWNQQQEKHIVRDKRKTGIILI